MKNDKDCPWLNCMWHVLIFKTSNPLVNQPLQNAIENIKLFSSLWSIFRGGAKILDKFSKKWSCDYKS